MIRKFASAIAFASSLLVVFASAQIAAAPAANRIAIAPAQTVSLSPAPGVTITVPRGWVSCDANITAQLGGAPDVPSATRAMCQPPSVHDDKFRVYDPDITRPVSIVIAHSGDRVFGDSLSTIGAADLQKQLCDSQTTPMIARGFVVNSCQVERVSLAGHRAVETKLSVSLSGIALRQRIFELDYGGGHLQITFKSFDTSAAATDPIIDALIGSIAIQ